VADRAQQIRERLDGFAPPTGEPPPQFVEILDPGTQTPEEIERWQQQWDEPLGTPGEHPMQILATAPRFYPGFEQMRAALLAMLDGDSTVRQMDAIAKALGIKVEDV